MKLKTILIILLANLITFLGCNESRLIEPPLEQKRPLFSKIVQPADSAFAYNNEGTITLLFSEPMDIKTFPGNFFLWEDEAKTISVQGVFSSNGNEVIFTPDQSLLEAHQYFTELRSRVRDIHGNGIDKDTMLVNETEFFTSGKYSENISPEFFISNGSEDILIKSYVKDGILSSDTIMSLDDFGRQLEMAFVPDGSKLIMTDYNSSNSGIYFIDAVNYNITKTLKNNIGGDGEVKKSAEICVGDKFAYVVNQSSKVLSIIDIASEEIIASLSIPGTPKGMAISPDFSKIYIGSGKDNQIWIVDAINNVIVDTLFIDGLQRSVRLAVSTDGKYLIIREFRGMKLFFIETANGSIAKTLELSYEAKSGNNNDLAVAGDFVYTSSSEGYLTKINTGTQVIVDELVFSNIQGIDIHPSSEILIATLRESPAKIAVILPENLKIIRVVEIGGNSPWDVIIRPNY